MWRQHPPGAHGRQLARRLPARPTTSPHWRRGCAWTYRLTIPAGGGAVIAAPLDAAALDDRVVRCWSVHRRPRLRRSPRVRPSGSPSEPPVGSSRREPRVIDGPLVVDLSRLVGRPPVRATPRRGRGHRGQGRLTARSDGARQGPAAFFDLTHGWNSPWDRPGDSGGGRDLARLIGAADAVIESARPRALEQMGIVAADVLGRRRPPGVDLDHQPRPWPGTGRTGGVRRCGRRRRRPGGERRRGTVLPGRCGHRPGERPVAAAAVLEALPPWGRCCSTWPWRPGGRVVGPAVDFGDAAAAALVGLPSRPRAPRALPVVRPAPPLGSDTAAVCAGRPGCPAARAAGVSSLLLRDADVDGGASTSGSTTASSWRSVPGQCSRGRRGDRVCGGRAAPGLHDHHLHLLAMAAAAESVDVSGGLDEAVRAAHANARPGTAICAVHYDEVRHGPLDRWRLDALAPGRAVRVTPLGCPLGPELGRPGGGGRGGGGEAGIERDHRKRPTGRLFRLDDWLRDRLTARLPPDLPRWAGALPRMAPPG